jgi:hypothetical protein
MKDEFLTDSLKEKLLRRLVRIQSYMISII